MESSELCYIVYVLLYTVQFVSMSRGDIICKRNLETCPPGHQLAVCNVGNDRGLYCEACTNRTFQPDTNKRGDRCRFRKSCHHRTMRYRDRGSITRDADCMCRPGYHFENQDQRACVPNPVCDIGYGQGVYGICEKCDEGLGFSDVKDTIQTCKRLTNCVAQGRCLLKRGDGTRNNECGSRVTDTRRCNESVSTGIIIGCVVASVVIIVFVAFIIFIYRRRHRKDLDVWTNAKKTDDVIRILIETSRNDPTFATKVLDRSCAIISRRIAGKQWTLAYELFQSHPDTAMYENVLFLYKGQSASEASVAFLADWRQWRGDNPDSIAALLECVRKCDRDDIIEALCKELSHTLNIESSHTTTTADSSPRYSLCPCSRTSSKREGGSKAETQPLQSNPDVVSQLYPSLTQPTAPVTEDTFMNVSNSSLTFPVQASS